MQQPLGRQFSHELISGVATMLKQQPDEALGQFMRAEPDLPARAGCLTQQACCYWNDGLTVTTLPIRDLNNFTITGAPPSEDLQGFVGIWQALLP